MKDPDTWWHLRIGEEFLDDWSLANPGHLTPFATRDWFATQWTTEILATELESRFGLAGVVWLAAVGAVLLLAVVYSACRERAAPLVSAGVAIVAVVAMLPSLAPRPQVLTFVFVALTLRAWLRTASDLRPRWWLVPLAWVWAATHGMWFIGIMIGVAAVAGLALDRRLSRSDALRLGAVPVLGLVAAGVTPVGPKLLLAPFATSKMTEFVTEWLPPDFHELAPLLVLAAVSVVAVSYARSPRPTSWFDLLLLGLAVLWLVAYARTVAVGAVLVAPFLATAVQSWRNTAPRTSFVAAERWLVAAAVIGVTAVLAAVGAQRPELAVSAPTFPTSQVDAALGRLPRETVVFNTAELGGWLEWRHRHVVPVADGLTDAYEVDYYSDYIDALFMGPEWYEFVRSTGAGYALLRPEQSITAALLDKGWRQVAAEDETVLLAAPDRS